MKSFLAGFLISALPFCLTCGAQAVAQDPQADVEAFNLQITVVAYNYAQVPHQTLDRAEREATRIFRPTGVELSWRNCHPALTDIHKDAGCTQVLGSTILGMRIVASFGAAQGITNSKSLGLVVGDIASVSFRRVQEEASIAGVMPCEILGPAMAHELGHLLLRQQGHSSQGIMRARWSREDFARAPHGTFAFTQEQTATIRSEVQRRTQEHAMLEAYTEAG